MTHERPETPLLDRVAGPSVLRQMPDDTLAALADEQRAEVISAVSETGGHLGSSLGVVEMSVAIHAVFNTPKDKLVWDTKLAGFGLKVTPAGAKVFVFQYRIGGREAKVRRYTTLRERLWR